MLQHDMRKLDLAVNEKTREKNNGEGNKKPQKDNRKKKNKCGNEDIGKRIHIKSITHTIEEKQRIENT